MSSSKNDNYRRMLGNGSQDTKTIKARGLIVGEFDFLCKNYHASIEGQNSKAQVVVRLR